MDCSRETTSWGLWVKQKEGWEGQGGWAQRRPEGVRWEQREAGLVLEFEEFRVGMEESLGDSCDFHFGNLELGVLAKLQRPLPPVFLRKSGK